jgi:hypothetical protein
MIIMRLQERDGNWVLPVAGSTITRICVDYAQVTILCKDVAINIEGKFALITPAGDRVAMDPQPSATPGQLAPILDLVRKVAREATVSRDSTLTILIEDGTRVEVPADPHFEAWNAADPTGAGGFKMVSMPGGELAIWQG